MSIKKARRPPTRLRKMRDAVRLSQWDVAVAVGISQAKYSEWERGYRQPEGDERRRLARTLQVTVADIAAAS